MTPFFISIALFIFDYFCQCKHGYCRDKSLLNILYIYSQQINCKFKQGCSDFMTGEILLGLFTVWFVSAASTYLRLFQV